MERNLALARNDHMRNEIFLLAAGALVLAGCGPKTLALPADPIEQAATCGVVAAAAAREAGGDIAKPLAIEASGRILHHALLAASTGASFESDKAAAVTERMAVLGDSVTGGKWQALVAPCNAAFPVAASTAPPALPADPLDAQLGCTALGGWLSRALASQDAAYGDQLFAYRQLGTALEPRVDRALSARGIESDDARKAARDKALAAIAKAGSPVPVMAACEAKYGEG